MIPGNRQVTGRAAMARTSARRSSSTVVRTYAAADRAAAEASYQRERAEAALRGWQPTSHRWRTDGREHVLTVIFEIPATGEDAMASSPAPMTAMLDASGTATAVAAVAAVAAATFSQATAIAQPPAPPTTTPVPWDATLAQAREADRLVVETIDLHCAGEPLRLIRSGYPTVPLLPIEDRRAWVRDHADHVRRLTMLEPRGHRDMYGAVLLPPARDDADIAVLFMHNEGYSTMCGHGIIALTHGLLEEGLYPASVPATTIRWETPAGLVTATADVGVGSLGEPVVRSVRFVNVPAYLHAERLLMRPRGVRLFGSAAERKALNVQLAFGGAFYGIVDVAELGMRVVPEQVEALTRAGAAITEALRMDFTPAHPTDPSLGFIYGTILVDSDPASSPDGRARHAAIRNVTVFADAEVDRSPCGSGTSALLAARYALGASEVGDEIVNAGITGESFRGRVEGVTWLGDREAVVTSIEGEGFVTGHHRFVVDERDPLGEGFLLR
jgi:proline racemase